MTIPEDAPIDAMDGAPVLHAPPVVALLSVVVLQSDVTPEIGVSGFTVTVTVAMQPIGVVYWMTVEPLDTPVITPELLPMVAIEVLPLIQVPPGAELDNVDE